MLDGLVAKRMQDDVNEEVTLNELKDVSRDFNTIPKEENTGTELDKQNLDGDSAGQIRDELVDEDDNNTDVARKD